MAMRLKRLPLHELRVEKNQLPRQTGAHATENFQGFGGLKAANDANQWGQNAHGGASRFFKLLRRRKDAGVAWRLALADVINRDLTVHAQSRA